MTPSEAKKIIKTELEARKLSFSKLSARTISSLTLRGPIRVCEGPRLAAKCTVGRFAIPREATRLLHRGLEHRSLRDHSRD